MPKFLGLYLESGLPDSMAVRETLQMASAAYVA